VEVDLCANLGQNEEQGYAGIDEESIMHQRGGWKGWRIASNSSISFSDREIEFSFSPASRE
jgi:hypothetical protein